jgi:hypothetical protein
MHHFLHGSAVQTGAVFPYDATTVERWWIGVKQENNVWVNANGKRVVSYTPHFEGNNTAAFCHWSYKNWDHTAAATVANRLVAVL